MKRVLILLALVSGVVVGHAKSAVASEVLQSFQLSDPSQDIKIERFATGWVATRRLGNKKTERRLAKDLNNKDMFALMEHLSQTLHKKANRLRGKKCLGKTANIVMRDFAQKKMSLCLNNPREHQIAKRFETILSYAFEKDSWHPMADALYGNSPQRASR